MQVTTEKNTTILNQIQNRIGRRILFCFLLLFIIVTGFAINDVSKGIFELKKNIMEQCNALQEFVINQVLVNNQSAVSRKIEDINASSPMKFDWIKDEVSNNPNKIQWILPFQWQYQFPLMSLDKQSFGYFKITGSLLDTHYLTAQLILRSALLMFFLILGFLMLYPVIYKIPRDLFAEPVNDILSLLEASASLNSDAIHKSRKNESVEIAKIKFKIVQLIEQAKRISKNIAIGEITSQVAHDIRSPLVALNVLAKNLSMIPEDQRLAVRKSIERINDIANNLINLHKPIETNDAKTVSAAVAVPTLAAIMVNDIVSEKRAAFGGKINIESHIFAEAYTLFIKVQAIEFKRMLANFIENSAQAIKEKGNVRVEVQADHKELILKIEDDGIGIPAENLNKIFDYGFTANKHDGTGLGLSHTKSWLEKWGGTIAVSSTVGTGTVITVKLPLSETPIWFPNRLNFIEDSQIVILDDDESIHQVWEQTLNALVNKVQLIHFYNSSEFSHWMNTNVDTAPRHYLIDFELIGDQENGLSLIKQFELASKSTLVTSRYNDKDLVDECVKQNIKLLPKELAPYIAVIVHPKCPSVIVIDDLPMVTEVWEYCAAKLGKKISTFNFIEEFYTIFDYFSRLTPVYIDYDLGKNVHGLQCAEILAEKGYSMIYLMTGYEKSHFAAIPNYIKDVVGKEPVF